MASYAQAVRVPAGSDLLFVSGQAPQAADGHVPGTFDEQCRLAWDNLIAVLAAAGMTVRNLVKVTVILAGPQHRESCSRIRREVLGDHRPAMLYTFAGLWADSWLLEIEAVAAG
ncbi:MULTISPECIES: RidA family protein [unclassified Streptomyces]|uniref:RidA family protein n=1 Tax=unclassified Streptomyces TaxID=2593676 RepID=UPI00136E84A5|nr:MULTISPECIES: RidA family protein [unclassified Streptomyces]